MDEVALRLFLSRLLLLLSRGRQRTPLRPSLLPNDALIVQAAEGEDENRLQHHSLGLQETLNEGETFFQGQTQQNVTKVLAESKSLLLPIRKLLLMSGYSGGPQCSQRSC